MKFFHSMFLVGVWFLLLNSFTLSGGIQSNAVWAQSAADADVLVARAVLAYDDEQYDSALGLLNEALALDPKDARGQYYKGLVHLARQEPELAVEPLEAAKALRPDDIHAQYQLGVAYFTLKDYDKAAPLFEAVNAKQPDMENLQYYVGFLRYRNKQYAEAAKAFEAEKSKDPRVQQLTKFYLGLTKGVLGLPQEAIQELEQAKRIMIVSPLTLSSIRIRDALLAGQAIAEPKRFRLLLSVGGYYDDNVAVNPDSVRPIPIRNPPFNPNALIINLRRRDTTAPGFLASLYGEYSFLRNGPFEAVATYSFFQTVNGEGLGDFNIQDHQVGLSGFYRGVLADIPFQLGLQYTYDYLFLDFDGFLARHTPRLSATVIEPTINLPFVGEVGNLTTMFYQYKVLTFFNEVVDTDPRIQGSSRDGYNNTLGFVHAFRLANDKLLLRIGYQYDNESTDGAPFSYSGNRLLTGGQLQLPWGEMTLRYDYDVHWRAYKSNQTVPFLTDREGRLSQRYDIQQTHLVQLTKPLPNNFGLTFQYQGIRNQSKIPVYDYTKNVWTAIVTWAY